MFKTFNTRLKRRFKTITIIFLEVIMKIKIMTLLLLSFAMIRAEVEEERALELLQKQEDLSIIGKKIMAQEELIQEINNKINKLILQQVDVQLRATKVTEEDNEKIRSEIFASIEHEASNFKYEYLKNITTDRSTLVDDLIKNLCEGNDIMRSMIKFYYIYSLQEQIKLMTMLKIWQNVANDLNKQFINAGQGVNYEK